MSNQYTSIPWPERFWVKVNKNGPLVVPALGVCWLWVGCTAGGYGAVRFPGIQKMQCAHRVSFLLENGYLNSLLDICHRCDTPLCVRPNHLFQGTETENLHDAVRKGRAGFHKFTVQQIHEIRERLNAGESQYAIAAEFSVHQSSISKIFTNRHWKKEVLCSESI